MRRLTFFLAAVFLVLVAEKAPCHEITFSIDPNDRNSLSFSEMRVEEADPLSIRRGRFLSVDPYLDVKKATRYPQGWNRYSYVMNNPINRIDPDGRADDAVHASMQVDAQLNGGRPNWDNDKYVAAGLAAGATAVAGAVVAAPYAVAAGTAAANFWMANKVGILLGAMGFGNAMLGPGSGPASEIPVSARNLKHISKHLGEFQKLDDKMTLNSVVALGRSIADSAANLINTSNGRGIYQAVVKIGDKEVAVRAVLNAQGGLRSVHIRY